MLENTTVGLGHRSIERRQLGRRTNLLRVPNPPLLPNPFETNSILLQNHLLGFLCKLVILPKEDPTSVSPLRQYRCRLSFHPNYKLDKCLFMPILLFLPEHCRHPSRSLHDDTISSLAYSTPRLL